MTRMGVVGVNICLAAVLYGAAVTLAADVKPRIEKYIPDYNIYHNLTAINTHLMKLARENPRYLKLDATKYSSKQGRSQPLLLLTDISVKSSKINVLFSYGEHSREFFPVESMFQLIETLLAGVHSGDFHSAKLLSRFNVYISAMLNPDGRAHVERTKNYCWRGTSAGVDLNRNFDWRYGGKGSSGNRNDEEYRGTAVFSEKETQLLRQLSEDKSFTAFISFHSGIKQIYLPYSDSTSKKLKEKPANYLNMTELAKEMAASSKPSFKYGVAWQLNEYTADGTIFDYMAGVRKVPFSYAIELWGVGDYKGAQCFDLFNPQSKNLKASLDEVFPLYKAFFNFLLHRQDRKLGYSPHTTFNVEDEAPPLSFGIVLLVCVVAIFIFFIVHNKLPQSCRVFPARKIISLRSLSSSFSFTKLKG